MTTTNINADTRLNGASGQSSTPLFDAPKIPDALLADLRGEDQLQASKESLKAVFEEIRNTGGTIAGGNLFFTAAAWLHCKWHSNCYALYAEYYFEAWVTTTEDGNGERLPVDLLEIRWRHGDTRGHETLNNAAMIAKSDRVYGNGWSCDSNICLGAVATRGGRSWGTASPADCVWGV